MYRTCIGRVKEGIGGVRSCIGEGVGGCHILSISYKSSLCINENFFFSSFAAFFFLLLVLLI